jgi:hypothetical protein
MQLDGNTETPGADQVTQDVNEDDDFQASENI